jgi:arginase family enzyme
MATTPTYATRPSFLGLERTTPDAKICIAGIPFDLGTSNRPGARFGPAAIRQASRMLVDGDHPASWTEIEHLDLADIGDFRVAHGDTPGSLEKIEMQAAALAHLVALGGDHTITLALLRALARRTGPLGLAHFDGHVDTWPESFGLAFGHGSPFYHAIEEGLIEPRARSRSASARRCTARSSTGRPAGG